MRLDEKRVKVEIPGVGWMWVILEEEARQFIKELLLYPNCTRLMEEFIKEKAGKGLI